MNDSEIISLVNTIDANIISLYHTLLAVFGGLGFILYNKAIPRSIKTVITILGIIVFFSMLLQMSNYFNRAKILLGLLPQNHLLRDYMWDYSVIPLLIILTTAIAFFILSCRFIYKNEPINLFSK